MRLCPSTDITARASTMPGNGHGGVDPSLQHAVHAALPSSRRPGPRTVPSSVPDEHRGEPHEERHPRAVDDPAQHVAPERIGAERERRAVGACMRTGKPRSFEIELRTDRTGRNTGARMATHEQPERHHRAHRAERLAPHAASRASSTRSDACRRTRPWPDARPGLYAFARVSGSGFADQARRSSGRRAG